jgi:superfamily II DNA or RNA helicase/SAM-dependent methyltransferase/SOS-response transcriptional repressor LexA
MSSTDYYNNNARVFFDATVAVDMSELRQRFLAEVGKSGHILDAGCGSGRDANYFRESGYAVSAFDSSPELARLATEYIELKVDVRTFQELESRAEFDGIWACASLLHVPGSDMEETWKRLWRALKPGGVIYASYKQGEGEREVDGRHFTDASEARLSQWVDALPNANVLALWPTEDQRPDRSDQWLNILVRKEVGNLVSGDFQDPFLPHLRAAIRIANRVDFAVAFIKQTGLRLLLPDLEDGLARSLQSEGSDFQLRLLTSDYLDVTDPEALRHLLQLQERGAEVRVFNAASVGFHLKAYLFSQQQGLADIRWGAAFVGSSNISRQALQSGIEWNYRIDYPQGRSFLEVQGHFNRLFRHPNTEPLSDAWIDHYEQRRTKPQFDIAPGSSEADPPPQPSDIQEEALQALAATRQAGYQRGLVVLATGMGKTWLAAFDTQQFRARRVLFVAHREEILFQAADTFQRICPNERVGFYTGKERDPKVDILCASIQTLGRQEHLNRFPADHFDYIVVDEFHHAAAFSYQALLHHFRPRFLLGLTATPDRTDNADILSLCDNNLVFESDLIQGVEQKLLVPFHYFGIFDSTVDYQAIPWRNGRFDPALLSHRLGTLARARHAFTTWQARAQRRTLAFCVSIRHAEFMAEHFKKQGVAAVAVYASSNISRGEALDGLTSGAFQVIFSVDLFNEGVDLPAIDTVMLLRPTDSKVMFLQQIGRGLRTAADKTHLVILDFVANHKGFLHKPQALLAEAMNYQALAKFGKRLASGPLEIAQGCYLNYDLELIDFFQELGRTAASIERDYQALVDVLDRRPTPTEFYRFGASFNQVRSQYGHWFAFVQAMGGLTDIESTELDRNQAFLKALETTAMTKSFKMILLEAFQELDGWRAAPTLADLARQSRQVLQRRPELLTDVPEAFQVQESGDSDAWQKYWYNNPVSAWINAGQKRKPTFFKEEDGCFVPKTQATKATRVTSFHSMVQELVDYRLTRYSKNTATVDAAPAPQLAERTELAYFPDLKIACGHFKLGSADNNELRSLGDTYGKLDPARHFIARATGSSMDGGKTPIADGDYLLLEAVTSNQAGSITNNIMAIERQAIDGGNEYLLRKVLKGNIGQYTLRALNPEYPDIDVTEDLTEQLRTFARFKAVVNPLDMAVGEPFMREDIPPLFNETFNPGNWNIGHVVLNKQSAHILLVTLNKSGKIQGHRYVDHWLGERHFYWQSQRPTTPTSKRGRELIQHQVLGIDIHLFVRENKLQGGKAAPFVYYGAVKYVKHEGSAPMGVTFELA